MYVWKFNLTVLEINFWADNILQHQSRSLMSSTKNHSTISAIHKHSFNSRSVTLSRKRNIGMNIKHAFKRVHFCIKYISRVNLPKWNRQNWNWITRGTKWALIQWNLLKHRKKYQYNYSNVINYKRTSTFLYNFLVGAVQL
jgi:hypothetical protein